MKKGILKKLQSEGYDCKMVEGEIVVTVRGRDIEIFVLGTSTRDIYTVIFKDQFAFRNADDINWVGSIVLSDAANLRYSTKVIGENGRYACSYQTAIRNTKDFMSEFDIACSSMLETIRWMSVNWDEAVKNWPAEKENKEETHIVGFRK